MKYNVFYFTDSYHAVATISEKVKGQQLKTNQQVLYLALNSIDVHFLEFRDIDPFQEISLGVPHPQMARTIVRKYLLKPFRPRLLVNNSAV